jgi:hypothetical protein
MTDILAISLLFLSASIFAAHAYDAYRRRNRLPALIGVGIYLVVTAVLRLS